MNTGVMDTGVEHAPTSRRQAVQLLVLDVDGVLTDGGLHYQAEGELDKRFHVHDGLGLKRCQRAGIAVALITARGNAAVLARAAELGIGPVLSGREDKVQALRELCAAQGITPAAVAYLGDDLPDLPALEIAGLPATVAQAPMALRRVARYICRRPGGAGAVREFCEWLLQTRA